MQLGVDAEEIYTIVNKAADAYEGAGSAVDSAAYHARFLRRLVSMDQERARQHADQNGISKTHARAHRSSARSRCSSRFFSATNALYFMTSNLSLGATFTHVFLWH